MSLDSQVLEYLKTGAAVTPALAWERWRITALHSLAARLRKAGHPVACEMKRANGRIWGSYTLQGRNA